MVQEIQATVTINSLFSKISQELGFSEADIRSHEDNIFELLELWEQQGFVEIYIKDSDRQFGRLKDSNSVKGSSPWYIDVYHARVSKTASDPLLVIRRDDEVSFSVRFLITHDQMFGSLEDKHNQALMKQIRKLIDSYIQQGSV